MELSSCRLSPEQQILVKEHLYLVNQILGFQVQYNSSYPDMNRDDLYQTGCLALCKAAICYDPNRSFAAYAARTIRNTLYDYVKKMTAYHKPLCTLEHLSELPAEGNPVEQLSYEKLYAFFKEHEKPGWLYQQRHCQRGPLFYHLKIGSSRFCRSSLFKVPGKTANDIDFFRILMELIRNIG